MKAQSVKLPQARQDELFIEQLGDEMLVYDAKRLCAHRLNSTAAWTWRHCDGRKTVAEATKMLSDEVQQPVDEELVWLSLETLDRAHLLSTPLQRPSGKSDDSRRAMLHKMAVAGGLMLLLPAVTPLTTPAEAQGNTPVSVKVPKGPAVLGTVTESGEGVKGHAEGGGIGVDGRSATGTGVRGASDSGPAIAGYGNAGFAVHGQSLHQDAIQGVAGILMDQNAPAAPQSGKCGVTGTHLGTGVGVKGFSPKGFGVVALSQLGWALWAEAGGGNAGYFKGNVEVTGDIRLLNADCAEDFDIANDKDIEPGTVMVLGDEGALQPGASAYDKRAAGVISGAGDFKPGLILDKRPTGRLRQPVALMGKVFCKVDASYGAVEAGDLLTTSDTPGHAMKAADPARAFGAVVGKALRALPEGQGLIPILVSLQ
jgi:hypothetical protein